MTKNLDRDEDGIGEGFLQLRYVRPFCLYECLPSHLS